MLKVKKIVLILNFRIYFIGSGGKSVEILQKITEAEVEEIGK